jgi:hypothetical protein
MTQPQQPTTPKVVQMWGPHRSGKTALLAAALFGPDSRQLPIARSLQSTPYLSKVSVAWKKLSNNTPVPPTTENEVSIPLLVRSTEVRIRDIRGGITDLPWTECCEMMKTADAILCVAECSEETIQDRMRVLAPVADLADERPVGMVFTKCERIMKGFDEGWPALPGWWKRVPFLSRFSDPLDRFGGAVWPTSAFGFDDTGNPAVLVGEFGVALPYQVRPKGVTRPFLWLFEKLNIP